jgi:hypothetical protein
VGAMGSRRRDRPNATAQCRDHRACRCGPRLVRTPPGCAPRTERAGGVPRDPARLRREMDRAAEALGLIWHRDPTHPPTSRDERLRKLHRPSSELRLGLP